MTLDIFNAILTIRCFMRDNLYEALDFFNLDELFTWDDLQDVYKPMAKNNHPDVNGLSKEEYSSQGWRTV